MAQFSTSRRFKNSAQRRAAFRNMKSGKKKPNALGADRHIGSIARRYARKFPTTTREDLVQEGHLARLIAAKRHQAKKGKLSTFAHKHIEGAISRAAKASHIVRTPEKTLRKTLKAGKKPAITVGIGSLGRRGKKRFTEATAHDGGIARAEAKATLDKLFTRLPKDEARVLHLRYRNGELTVAKAAKRMKRSPATVHGIERRGLARLRKLSRGKR